MTTTKNKLRPARSLLATFYVLQFAICICMAAEPLRLVSTIPLPGVKGRFDHFSIDAKGNRLFVAALGNNTVEVIDLAAGKRLHSIPNMSKPQGVLYLEGQIVVANGGEGTFKLFNAASFELVKSIGSLDDADNMRFDPKWKRIYVGYGDGALAVIDPFILENSGETKLAGHPESFQLEKRGSRIFVNVPDAKQIAVIDRDKKKVLATWPMKEFQANFPMALDETDHRLLVGCRKPARLVVFNTEAGKLVADLAICGDTDDLFHDAKRKRIYISCGEGFLDVVEQTSPDKYERTAHIPTASGARTCFFSSDLDRLFLGVPDRGNQRAEIRVYQPE
jgi:DNA-binding beta-propeller fold protein YncE